VSADTTGWCEVCEENHVEVCERCNDVHHTYRIDKLKRRQLRCPHHSKRTKRQCNGALMSQRKGCKFHGGKVPVAEASPHFKHGKHSKYSPQSLRTLAEVHLRNPDPLSLLRSIALVEARLEKAQTYIDGDLALWEEIGKAVDAFEMQTNDDKKGLALYALLGVCRRGVTMRDSLRDLSRLTEEKRKLIETEIKKQTAEREHISIERMNAFILLLVDVVAKHVTDRGTVGYIIDDLRRLQSGGGTVARRDA